jgi:hypothetical protein
VFYIVVILVVVVVVTLYLRNLIIADIIKRVRVGDIYIDPECNRVNSKYLSKWMEYRVIKKTNSNIICEHYWRETGISKLLPDPIATHVSFTHKEFFYKFKRYEI